MSPVSQLRAASVPSILIVVAEPGRFVFESFDEEANPGQRTGHIVKRIGHATHEILVVVCLPLQNLRQSLMGKRHDVRRHAADPSEALFVSRAIELAQDIHQLVSLILVVDIEFPNHLLRHVLVKGTSATERDVALICQSTAVEPIETLREPERLLTMYWMGKLIEKILLAAGVMSVPLKAIDQRLERPVRVRGQHAIMCLLILG